MLVLLLGGARSGKSALAVRLAEESGSSVTFIATGEARDGEMADRISRHRGERPGRWETVEAPVRIASALTAADPHACVVLDCLTLWAANALEELGAAEAEANAANAAASAHERGALTIAVSNEVGLGLVPNNPLGRAYRDLLGRVNAIWAEAADHVLLVVAGRALHLREADAALEVLR